MDTRATAASITKHAIWRNEAGTWSWRVQRNHAKAEGTAGSHETANLCAGRMLAYYLEREQDAEDQRGAL